MNVWLLALYGLPFAAVTAYYLRRQSNNQARHLKVLEDSVASGMTEPASLHPVIDESRCLGCGACVKANRNKCRH